MTASDIAAAAELRGRALVERDWEALDAALHPEFVYVNAQGSRLSRADYLTFVRDGPLRWKEQRLEDLAIRVVGSVGVLTAILNDDVEVDGSPHLLRFVTTQTYVLEGGRWLYLAGHTSAAAA